MTPLCHRCKSSNSVAVYDAKKVRVPLCAACAVGAGTPIVDASDLPSVAKSDLCWCALERTGLSIAWCPNCHK